jgi:hypothetical protein
MGVQLCCQCMRTCRLVQCDKRGESSLQRLGPEEDWQEGGRWGVWVQNEQKNEEVEVSQLSLGVREKQRLHRPVARVRAAALAL